jgi:hypothetical protein
MMRNRVLHVLHLINMIALIKHALFHAKLVKIIVIPVILMIIRNAQNVKVDFIWIVHLHAQNVETLAQHAAAKTLATLVLLELI